MKKIIVFSFLLSVLITFLSSNHALSFDGGEYTGQANSGSTIILRLDAEKNRVSGRVANSFMGSYTINGSSIRFSPIASTMMMGPDEDMEAERELFDFLGKASSFEERGNTLILKDEDGNTMEFTRDVPAKKPDIEDMRKFMAE